MTRTTSESDCAEVDCGGFLDLDGYLNNGSTRQQQHAKDQLVVDAGTVGLAAAGRASSGGTSTSSESRHNKQLSYDSGVSYTSDRRNRKNKVTSSTIEKFSKSSYMRSKPYAKHTERHIKPHSILTERPSKLIKNERNTSEHHPTITDMSTGYSSTKYRSDISLDKIIMSTLEELYRLLAERRELPMVLPAARRKFVDSRTISDLTPTNTTHKEERTLQKRSQFGRSVTGAPGRGGECIVAYALSNNIPRIPKVGTESVVRAHDSSVDSQDVMPGGFHLDDPVRLYQQAKQLQATCGDRLASSSSRQFSSSPPQSRKQSEDAPPPSLCALCRHYWRVARRYLSAYTAELR